MEASVRSIAEGGGGAVIMGEYQVGDPSLRKPGEKRVESSSRRDCVLSDVREPKKVALRLKSPPTTKGRLRDASVEVSDFIDLTNLVLARADRSVHFR